MWGGVGVGIPTLEVSNLCLGVILIGTEINYSYENEIRNRRRGNGRGGATGIFTLRICFQAYWVNFLNHEC